MIFNCPVPSLITAVGCLILIGALPTVFFGTWALFDIIYEGEIPQEHDFHLEPGWENSNFQHLSIYVLVAYFMGWAAVILTVMCCCCMCKSRRTTQYVYLNSPPPSSYIPQDV